jgi:hypothetical protein
MALRAETSSTDFPLTLDLRRQPDFGVAFAQALPEMGDQQ